jgi:membrane-associated HD superfamily phosphohydrolase
MFGFGPQNSKSYLKLLMGIVLIVLLFFVGKSYLENDNLNQLTTGQVISGASIDQPQLTDQQNTQPSTTTEEEQTPNETTDEEDYDTYEYYEYGGECSYDIEKAEDDVNDVLSYSKENEDKSKALKDEYDRKLQELQEQYTTQIDVTQEQTTLDQQALQEAQNKLKELQEVCSF